MVLGDYIFRDGGVFVSEKKKSVDKLLKLISKLKSSEDDPQDNLRRLVFALETNEVGIWEINLREGTAYRSPRYNLIFGYESIPPGWSFESLLQHVWSEDRDKVEQSFVRFLEQPGDLELEFRIVRRDKTVRWVWACIHFQAGSDGQLERITGVIQDITDRKLMEEALKESEKCYHSLFELAGDAILLLSDGVIIDCNFHAQQMFGVRREELLARSLYHLSAALQPDGQEAQEKAREFIAGALSEIPQFFEWKFQRLDKKETFDADVSLKRIDLSGKIILMTIIRDIANRKKMEDELKKAKEMLEQRIAERTIELNAELAERKKVQDELQIILETVPVPIFYKNRENSFVLVNQAFETLMGMPREKLEGTSLFDLYPTEHAELYWQDDREVMETGKTKTDIIEPLETEQGTRLLQVTKRPFLDKSGRIIGVIGFALDVTDQKS